MPTSVLRSTSIATRTHFPKACFNCSSPTTYLAHKESRTRKACPRRPDFGFQNHFSSTGNLESALRDSPGRVNGSRPPSAHHHRRKDRPLSVHVKVNLVATPLSILSLRKASFRVRVLILILGWVLGRCGGVDARWVQVSI